jgi:hypothetical protein
MEWSCPPLRRVRKIIGAYGDKDLHQVGLLQNFHLMNHSFGDAPTVARLGLMPLLSYTEPQSPRKQISALLIGMMVRR